jgi:hypothetical protein
MVVFFWVPVREREPGILFLTVEFHFVKLKRPAAGMIQLMFITSNSPDTLYFTLLKTFFQARYAFFFSTGQFSLTGPLQNNYVLEGLSL